MIFIGFIFSLGFAIFSTWEYIYTKKKEDEGVDFGYNASSSNIVPMLIAYFCTFAFFLILIGAAELPSKDNHKHSVSIQY